MAGRRTTAAAERRMSWSSGSSAPGFQVASGRRRATESRSPVPYRENPMAYEPAKFCHCNPRRKAPRWISWSDQNPGRRYYASVDALNGYGCGFVEWHDGTLPKFWSDLLGDLRDEVWRLCGVKHVLPQPEEEAGALTEARLQAMEEELKRKNREIADMKGKYENWMLVFVVFVFGVVAGKFFIQ